MIMRVLGACTLLLTSVIGNPVNAQGSLPGALFSAVEFPESFRNPHANGSRPVADIAKRTNAAGTQYWKLLEEKKPFSGLYVSGDYTRSVDGSRYGYTYGVEWELYNQGWDEAKRELNKKKLESQLQFLNLQNQMQTRQHDEKIYFIHRIEDTTTYYVNSLKLQDLTDVLARAEEKFKKGYLTRNEIEDWRLRLANTIELNRYYSTSDKVSLHPQTLELLNRFQQANLKPAEFLFQTATQNSIELKIQALMKKRSQFFPQWKDNVSLRLFVERRRDFNRLEDDVAGVRIRLPIGSDTRRKDIIGYEQQVYQEQGSAIIARMKQRIRYLHSQFYFHRSRLRQQKNEMDSLEKKIQTQREYSKRSVPSLEYTPDKAILELELQRLDLYQDALLTRLKMYTVATELESLVRPQNFTELFLPL